MVRMNYILDSGPAVTSLFADAFAGPTYMYILYFVLYIPFANIIIHPINCILFLSRKIG